VVVVATGILTAIGLATAWSSPGHAARFSGYRAIHLESGTSPLLPVILLLLAIYLFCWMRLDRLRMVEEREATRPCPGDTQTAVPRIGPVQWGFAGAAVLAWWFLFRPLTTLATVEGDLYDSFLALLSALVIFLLTLVLVRFCYAWRVLRKLLQDLEHHPLRYAFSRLPKDFSWTAVWTGDPRPKMIIPARCLDVLRMVQVPEAQAQVAVIERNVKALKDQGRDFSKVPDLLKDLTEGLDKAFAAIWSAMEPAWAKGVSASIAAREKDDGVPDDWKSDPGRIEAEEFLALRLVHFISYVLRMIRGFLEFVLYGFVLLALGLATYPFEGRRHIEVAIVLVFLVAGACVGVVFAQMDRDPLLSRLNASKPNELSLNFVYRLVSFGALPLVTLLASQVPEVGNFLLSWLQPALQALK